MTTRVISRSGTPLAPNLSDATYLDADDVNRSSLPKPQATGQELPLHRNGNRKRADTLHRSVNGAAIKSKSQRKPLATYPLEVEALLKQAGIEMPEDEQDVA